MVLIGAVVAGLWPDHDRPADGAKIVAIAVAAFGWLFAELSGISKPSEHDLALFEKFRSSLNERDRELLRSHDFDNSFAGNETAGLREIASWTGVAYEFNDAKIEKDWSATRSSVDEFVTLVGKHTGPINGAAGRFSVHPSNSYSMQPQDWVATAITDLSTKGTALSKKLEDFERASRRRLGL